MTKVRIACIQTDICLCRKEKNIEKALSMIGRAVSEGAEIIVLPEVFSTGFCYEHMSDSSEARDGPTLELLSDLSRTNGCIIVSSVIESESSEEGTKYFNLGFCIEAGVITGTYRKTHPFNKEKQYFTPGNVISPIKLQSKDITIGLQICYELRFPEVARKLSLMGADILVTIAEFPKPRRELWQTLVRARAIENQMPHVACNRTGSDPDTSFFGTSMIVDASGEIKVKAGEEESILIYDVDTAETSGVREVITVLKDRRADLY
ncbi:nitrilase-related carbon-nitrogen hydrolase [Methanolobus halotolerans]|uniref:Carbon-nitrogen hydrolase n=1 Tax=Methanolobus halotolerans TaxID=2052935 RepID=A0A4E0PWA1_9EURY|nr:nitrilase-related carbon-nitrogen hydrolase [Methanolobus halotolerans]TGC09641.1 carbon-nitrogen hydrolase [Methanolobus halotolerans]